MSHNDIEIEMKFPVTLPLFNKVLKKLQSAAEFKGEVRQIDHYFNAPHRDFLKPKHPVEYLRLREINGKGILTYKFIHFDANGEKSHCDEFETNIEKISQIRKILDVLDFKEFMAIDNKRKKFIFDKDFEIVLDNVKELGHFIEIESKKFFGSIKETNDKIEQVAEDLGINASTRSQDGYVLAMLKKKGLK